MQVYEPRSSHGVFHLVAEKEGPKVLCRLNTPVPNAVDREDLGGFTLSRKRDTSELRNFRLATRDEDSALRDERLCGRCRKSSSIRRLNSEGRWH